MTAAAMVFAVPAAGQDASVEHNVFQDYLNPSPESGGVLRLPGLDFKSSIGFSYLSGGDDRSVGMGYYMGHFSYSLGGSLKLDWDIGVGSYLHGQPGSGQYDFFIPNVDLTYRPSDRLMLKLQYRQGGVYSPFSMRRSGAGF